MQKLEGKWKTIAVVTGAAFFAWLLVSFAAFRQRLPRSGVPGPPVTVPFDSRLQTGSDDLPLSQLSRKGGTWDPEQIHIAIAGPGAIFVSWSTHNATVVETEDDVVEPDLKDVASVVYWGINEDNLTEVALGNRTNYIGNYPRAIYVSGIFHHAKITGLHPSQDYYYRCGDPDKALSKIFKFRSPSEVGPKSFPQRIAVIGDLGQTYNSSTTLDHLEANDPPVVWLVGDFSYSDNYTPQGQKVGPSGPWPTDYHNSYQPRWDSWGRFTQRIFATRFLQGLHGNHEIELDVNQKKFQAYTHRYIYPWVESGSTSPHYYSFDIAGAHVIHLASYEDFDSNSQQYKWLQSDLDAFSRERTPWLLVNWHAPWYHTYIAHYKEANCHRLSMERILYDAGVDIVFSGHVHAYSCSRKVFNYSLDDCGLHHVVIGDGGNIERLYTHWVDEQPSNCPDPSSVPCPTYEAGAFCPTQQPDWSAYREPSFGHGILTLENNHSALWQWHRNQDGVAEVAHTLRIQRNTACHNQKS